MDQKENNKQNTNYFIDVPGDFPEGKQAPNPTYLIVRSLKCQDGRSQRGYALQPGNIIKLGRIEYRVLEIFTGNPAETDLNQRRNTKLVYKDKLHEVEK